MATTTQTIRGQPAVYNAGTVTLVDQQGAALQVDINGNLKTTTQVSVTLTEVGNKTNNNAAPGANNLGVLPGIANAAAQSWTEGNQVLLSMDLAGNTRVVPSPSAAATSAVSMVQSTAYEASHVIKASSGNLYGMFGYNSKTSAQFIQVFNSTTVPADTAVPIITFTVAASSNFSLDLGTLPINFATGISVSNSSTGPTKTIGAADCWFNVLYN